MDIFKHAIKKLLRETEPLPHGGKLLYSNRYALTPEQIKNSEKTLHELFSELLELDTYPKVFWQNPAGDHRLWALKALPHTLKDFFARTDKLFFFGPPYAPGKRDDQNQYNEQCNEDGFQDFDQRHLELFLPGLVLEQREGRFWLQLTLLLERPLEEGAALEAYLDNLFRKIAPEPLPAKISTHLKPQPSRDQWIQRAQKTIDLCAGKTPLKKVVLSRRERLFLEPWTQRQRVALIKDIFRENQKENLPNYFYYFALSTDQFFLSQTPELLLKREGPQITSWALAGTMEAASFCPDDLLGSLKNRHEQKIVIDDLRLALKNFVQEESFNLHHTPFVLELGNIIHLQTVIQAYLKDEHQDPLCLFPIIEAIAPTAALGGSPKPLALDTLKVMEPYQRGPCGAPFGWIAGTRAEFAVGIRCIEGQFNAMDFWAGCGLVAQSDPHAEWEETLLKMSRLKRLVQAWIQKNDKSSIHSVEMNEALNANTSASTSIGKTEKKLSPQEISTTDGPKSPFLN